MYICFLIHLIKVDIVHVLSLNKDSINLLCPLFGLYNCTNNDMGIAQNHYKLWLHCNNTVKNGMGGRENTVIANKVNLHKSETYASQKWMD